MAASAADHPLLAFDPAREEDRAALTAFLAAHDRRQAGALADRLLTRFGSLAGLLGADRDLLLRAVPERGTDVALLLAARDLVEASLRNELRRGVNLDTGRAVVEYLRLGLRHEKREIVRVLFLDSALRLVADDVVGVGSVTWAAVSIREIVRRALECGASGLLVAHNHPAADPTPSPADIAFTYKLASASDGVDLTIVDHIIIAGRRWSSMKEANLL